MPPFLYCCLILQGLAMNVFHRLCHRLAVGCGVGGHRTFIVYARIFMWLNIFNFRGGTKPTFFNIFAVSLALVGGLALGQGRWERGKRTGKLLYDKEP